MTKSKEGSTKNDKKVAVKSLKEKRAAKAAKREEKNNKGKLLPL